MAVTQASVTAPLGHQGAKSMIARYTTRRSLPIMGALAGLHISEKGYPSAYFPRYGTSISATALAEGASAVTPTTTPTINGVTITPAGFVASMGLTDEADYRATAENDPFAFQKKEISYALQRYIQIDSSVGLAYQFSQVTAVDGNTGAALTRAGLKRAANKVWSAIKGANTHLVAVIDQKGRQDLEDEALASAGAAYGSEAMTDELRQILAENPFLNANNHMLSLGLLHVFVEADSDALLTASGDKVGCVFVPGPGMFPGQDEVSPAFVIVSVEDPMSLSKNTVVNGVEELDTQVGKLSIAVGSFVGQRQATQYGFGCAATGILSQASACKLLYSAT